ncbi:NUDIX domain-containing protein [Cognatiluteimonas profundi]|uniref:NUDIX domain-containing protein n=1 Tax=Cognatiluteimonas profundi TaxID=2594501 RepID=UPI00131B3EEC|nr:NUDIX domain-containing protein [Lysobacter profundi]
MPNPSAGILLFKHCDGELQVLLAHPGGPLWRHRDDGAWSIPKGELAPGEAADVAARREFAEETGVAPDGVLQTLGTVRQRGGKQVEAFALEGDFDVTSLRSNPFGMEWPPRSGQLASFPEIDRVEWFSLPVARRRILDGQLPFLDRLALLQGHAPD